MFDHLKGIDWARTSDLAAFEGEDGKEFAARMRMARAGAKYLREQKHCVRLVGVRWGNVAMQIPRVAVLLCEVESSNEQELGRYVWVVTGDVSPLVIDARRCCTPYQALAEYCDQCEQWSRDIREGVVARGAELTVAEEVRAKIFECWARWIERMYVEPNRWMLIEPTGEDWERVGRG